MRDWDNEKDEEWTSDEKFIIVMGAIVLILFAGYMVLRAHLKY